MNAKTNLLFAALLGCGLAACGGDNDVDATADVVPPADTLPADPLPAETGPDMTGEGTITVANYEDGGSYLADSAGNAVYMVESDTDGLACVGDCIAAWPPVLVDDMQPTVASGVDLDPALLGTVERDDGSMQVTYNGHPLYRYAADTGANRIAGHDVQDQWGHWYLVTPDGMEFDMEMGADASASMQDDGAAENGMDDAMPGDGD